MERAKKFYKSVIGLDKTSFNHKRVLTTFFSLKRSKLITE